MKKASQHPKNSTSEAIDLFNAYAEHYARKYADVSLYQTGLQRFCDELKKGSSILELGCGPGNVSAFVHLLRPDVKMLLSDGAADMVRLAQTALPDAEVRQMNFITELGRVGRCFDGLLFAFGLPYVPHSGFEDFGAQLASVCADKSVIFLSFMRHTDQESLVQTSSDGKHELLTHYYHPDRVSEVFERHNFRTIWMEEIQNPVYGTDDILECVLVLKRKY